jgi:hypothetical protein
MTWTVVEPWFEILETSEGTFWWQLWNRGEVVATSVGEFTKSEIEDFVYWVNEGPRVPRGGPSPGTTAP